MKAEAVFVTGTDTGVGKTHVSALLVRAQRVLGRRAAPATSVPEPIPGE